MKPKTAYRDLEMVENSHHSFGNRRYYDAGYGWNYHDDEAA